jgi:hypothetical protein
MTFDPTNRRHQPGLLDRRCGESMNDPPGVLEATAMTTATRQ